MRIACCEDEKVQAELIRDIISGWCAQSGKPCSVDLYNSAESFLFELNGAESIPYDLLILDIAMERMDGFTLARHIRKKDKLIKIAFLTADASRAPEGYEIDAWRYILKPLDESKISEMLSALCISMENRNMRYCLFEVSGEHIRVNLDDLIYLEAEGHFTVLHFGNRELTVKESFRSVLDRLNQTAGSAGNQTPEVMPGRTERSADAPEFVRCHRSIAVNVTKVRRIGREQLSLEGEMQLPVTRGMYQELNRAFIRVNL